MNAFDLSARMPDREWYFLRHGTTGMNQAHILNGRIDEPLATEGVRQAEAIAPLMAGLGIDKICSSPLRRALRTARILAAALDLPLTTHADLAEANLGIWQGQVNTGQGNLWRAGAVPKGGVSFDSFRLAVAQAAVDVLSVDKSTLIVSHGAVHWALCVSLGIKSPPLGNCLPVVFFKSGGVWKMRPALSLPRE